MADENPTPERDDRRRRGPLAWLWIAVPVILLIVVGIIGASLLGGDDSEPVGAGSPEAGMVETTGTGQGQDFVEGEGAATEGTPPATGPGAPSGTSPDANEAPEDGATTSGGDTAGAPVGGDAPGVVRSDPLVIRLARGRSLPFTAGPWRRAAWRDAVYGRLRPVTRSRAERVAYRGGFGIRLR